MPAVNSPRSRPPPPNPQRSAGTRAPPAARRPSTSARTAGTASRQAPRGPLELVLPCTRRDMLSSTSAPGCPAITTTTAPTAAAAAAAAAAPGAATRRRRGRSPAPLRGWASATVCATGAEAGCLPAVIVAVGTAACLLTVSSVCIYCGMGCRVQLPRVGVLLWLGGRPGGLAASGRGWLAGDGDRALEINRSQQKPTALKGI